MNKPVYLKLISNKDYTYKYIVYNATDEMTNGKNYRVINNIIFYRKPYSDRVIDDDVDWEIITEEEFKMEAL